jgi:hypothetical protein
MKLDLARGVTVCVSGMLVSLIVVLLILQLEGLIDPVGKAGYDDFPATSHPVNSIAVSWALVSSAGALVATTAARRRLRANSMAARLRLGLFVLGVAISATVFGLSYLWASGALF